MKKDTNTTMAVKGAKALEVWARRVTDGYPGVRISNMSSAWKDGLAFCAIVHRFRPDLIDFHALEPGQIERNCSLIFALAEAELGIPSLLDPVDMAECKSPDRLSILTYLSEFYHKFKAEKSPQGSPETNKKEDAGFSKSQGTCPDLKRKDSCDSGVSVSPLGSVCNSPPSQKKDTNHPEQPANTDNHITVSASTTSSKYHMEKRELDTSLPLGLSAPVATNGNAFTDNNCSLPSFLPSCTSMNKSSFSSTQPFSDKSSDISSNGSPSISSVDSISYSIPSLNSSASSPRPSLSPSLSLHSEDKPCGLERLLKQRLLVTAEVKSSAPQSSKQRRSLLNSMISVSSSTDNEEHVQSNSQKELNTDSSRKDLNRRYTLGSEMPTSQPFLVNVPSNPKKGNVFNLSQNFTESKSSPSDSIKFISKTTINLSPNSPITYSPNNSVTCDIKSPCTLLQPRPWKEPSMAESVNPGVAKPDPGRELQGKVAPLAGGEHPKAGTNLIVIKPNIDGNLEEGKNRDKNGNVESNEVDKNVKSRMMKFERLISNPVSWRSGDHDDETISDGINKMGQGPISLNSCNDESKSENCESSKLGLTKTISLPNKMLLTLSDKEETRLSF